MNIVITGGNSGIGFEAAKKLYSQGHCIIFGSRNQQKNNEALQQIKKLQGNGSIKAYKLDLSRKSSIEQFAKKVRENFNDRIDILLNNAGLAMTELIMSQLNTEMTMAINHYGHFYLTYLLFDLIRKAKQARIVNVSSILHKSASDRSVTDQITFMNKNFDPMSQYHISKLANVLFTQGLYKRLTSKYENIKTVSLCPGVVDTNFFNIDSFSAKCFRCMCFLCLFQTPEDGSRTTMYVLNLPFQQLRNGQFYTKEALAEMNPRGRNPKQIQQLWQRSQELYGIKFQI